MPDDKPESVIQLKLTGWARLALWQTIMFTRRCGKCQVEVMSTSTIADMIQHQDLIAALKLDVFDGVFPTALLDTPEVDFELSEVLAKRVLVLMNRSGMYITMVPSVVLAETYALLDGIINDTKVEPSVERSYELNVTANQKNMLAQAVCTPVPCTACTTPTDGFHPSDWAKVKVFADQLGLWPHLLVLDPKIVPTGDREDKCKLRRDVMEFMLPRLATRVPLVKGGLKGLTPILTSFERMRVGEVAPVPE